MCTVRLFFRHQELIEAASSTVSVLRTSASGHPKRKAHDTAGDHEDDQESAAMPLQLHGQV